MKTLLVSIVATLSLSACATHSINYTNPSAPPGGAISNHKQSFFLWGLVGGSQVDLARTCPNGVARITSRQAPVDGILAAFTGGIYSPMSVQVQCAGGSAAAEAPATSVAKGER
jgi:hypothetical protein